MRYHLGSFWESLGFIDELLWFIGVSFGLTAYCGKMTPCKVFFFLYFSISISISQNIHFVDFVSLNTKRICVFIWILYCRDNAVQKWSFPEISNSQFRLWNFIIATFRALPFSASLKIFRSLSEGPEKLRLVLVLYLIGIFVKSFVL